MKKAAVAQGAAVQVAPSAGEHPREAAVDQAGAAGKPTNAVFIVSSARGRN